MTGPRTAAAASPPRPLAGIRVIDISTVMAGPFATHMLAEQGADVIKVEPPEGDIMRYSGAAPEPGMSPIFQHMNRNKRSIVLDLKKPAGREALMDLVRGADAFVYNMRPRAMAKLGLDHEQVRGANPRIVYCGIVGFGQKGPYAGRPAYDDLIQGISGIPDLVGRANGTEPRYVPLAFCDRITGLYASNALLAALVERARTGVGAAIEIPMFEASVHFLLVEHLFGASFDPPVGAALNNRMLEPNRRPYRTRDGYICVLPYTTRHWHSLFDLLGCEEMKGDPRFVDFASRREHIDVLYDLLETRLGARDSADWLAALEDADIPAVRANSVAQLREDPHLLATGFFSRVEQRDGAFLHMASPARWAGRSAPQPSPAPLLSEHARQVLLEAGFSEERIAALQQEGVTGPPRDG